jgi:hypothetical protein
MRSALHVAAGFATGVAGMGAIAAWGSSPQAYMVSCRPEGTKTNVICKVVEMGRLWSLDSGWYLDAESENPDWKLALGAACFDRYREYRDYADSFWKKLGDNESTARLAESDPRFSFECYNRGQS